MCDFLENKVPSYICLPLVGSSMMTGLIHKNVQRTYIAKPINGTHSVILEDYTAECTGFEHFLRGV